MGKLSRRSFIKGAGLGAVGLAGAAALTACSPNTGDAGGGTGNGATSGGGDTATSGWRTPPAEVTDFVAEHDFEVVCVGHGYGGVTACRELAEQGVKVALIEVQPEGAYAASGNESAALNSKVLDRVTAYNPIPHVDPVEYFDNWMTIIGNQGNPGLIMRYIQNMGENIDWYYDQLTDADFTTITHTGWPNEGETWEHILPNIGPIKFWPGTFSCYSEECNQTKVQGYNREVAKQNGAEFFFGTRGEQLIMEGGKVAGVVASTGEGYLKFNCKAVVINTGGFAYNEEMLNDLMPDIKNNMTDDEVWKDAFGGVRFPAPDGMQYQGDGIKMAYWAGAHLESLIAGMNAKHIQPPSGMTNLPQAVWVRNDGKRFCNEFYPVVEHRGIPNVYMRREPINCVFDDDFTTYRSYYVPQHGGAEPSAATIEALRAGMDEAYAKFKGTWVEPEDTGEEEDPMAAMFAPPAYIADDTLEGLAGQLGLTGDAVAAFVAQIERYNGYCDTGVDEEFGRYKEVLFPVRRGPFYAVAGNPGFGEIMATCGGIITDADQNALDKDFEPIPGLYVSGNDCGRRFGLEYVTPTPGVSLSTCITLGRECGKSVAKWIKG